MADTENVTPTPSPEDQKEAILNILNMVLADPDDLGSYLNHVGFDIAAIRLPSDLQAAFLGHYRIRPGVFDVARAHEDLLNYPPVARRIRELLEERVRSLSK